MRSMVLETDCGNKEKRRKGLINGRDAA